MRHLKADTRYALRTLRSNPVFAAVAILTIALGVGANAAVFSVLNSVVLAPLPYDRPERLVRIYTANQREPTLTGFSSGLDLIDVREQVAAFSSVAMVYTYREVGGDLGGSDGDHPQRVRVLPVSAEYFSALGASPLLGRTFRREEERPDARVLILSHHLWSSMTGRDPSIVSRTIALNGEAYEVIGVMRPGFADVAGEAAAWTPQNLQRGGPNNVYNQYLSGIARLRVGVSLARAQAEVDVLMNRLGEQFPDTHRERRLRVVPLHEDVVGESRWPLYVLMGAAGLVLLIACLNVANLLLSRSLAQSRESAIRTALGAAPARLVVQRLTESVVLALLGGVMGSAVAYWGVRVLLAVSPESLARAESIRFDGWLLAFAFTITTLTGLLFGAGPALRAARAHPALAMREGSRGNTGGRTTRQLRSVLVASQICMALVLLVGAGILIRSFMARQRVDLGIEADNVATFELHLPASRYASAEQRIQLHYEFHERLRSLPGLVSAGATSWLPANGDYHEWGFSFTDDQGERQRTDAQIRVVAGDYFATLAIAHRRGAAFNANHRFGTDGVALISESLARHAFGERDPLGQRFRTAHPGELTVIGVVADVANEATGKAVQTVYLSHTQLADNRNWALTYVVRTRVPPMQIIEPARRVLSGLDPALVLYQPRAMNDLLARHRARHRFTLLLMVTFAAVALSLAAVGVYGVLSYTVSQRTHEIGVRIALGARPGQVRAIVMSQAMMLGTIGICAGLTGAFALSRLLESLAFGVSTRDPLVFAGVALVLAIVVTAAAYIPAHRATRVRPLDALRR